MWLLLRKTLLVQRFLNTQCAQAYTLARMCARTHTQFIKASSFLSSKNRLILNNILTKAFFVFLNVKGLRVYFVYEFADV